MTVLLPAELIYLWGARLAVCNFYSYSRCEVNRAYSFSVCSNRFSTDEGWASLGPLGLVAVGLPWLASRTGV